jgi:glyoxylase-like metal-dependent hydrolase (beta-lactamase superfamily II)
MATTEKILPHLYVIEVPLPKSPLKALNSYVIKGSDRALVVDTGFNRPECLAALRQGLHELQVDLDHTDFFITHLHADHLGLVSQLVRPGQTVYFNAPDAEIVRNWKGWDDMVADAGRNGFPADSLRNTIHSHPGYRFGPDKLPELTLLKDGDVLDIGDYRFHCIFTPGHTPGHLCLHERQKHLFVAGDHLLHDITPNITGWRESVNPLRNYLESLEAVKGLEVDLVLPGHRRRFDNHTERIVELRHHHQKRNEEILAILRGGAQNAYDIAARMTWDLDCSSWEDFPLPQKWFATGEALAHLRYLEEEGKVCREAQAPVIRFTLA